MSINISIDVVDFTMCSTISTCNFDANAIPNTYKQPPALLTKKDEPYVPAPGFPKPYFPAPETYKTGRSGV